MISKHRFKDKFSQYKTTSHEFPSKSGDWFDVNLMPKEESGPGWFIVVRPLTNGRHELLFKRAEFDYGDVARFKKPLVRPRSVFRDDAWVTPDGVAHLPDDDMRTMDIDDRTALGKLLS